MNSTWKLNNKNSGVLTVTVDGDLWKNACELIWKREAEQMTLPHFKKVPVIVAKKHIDPNKIYEQAILDAMERVYSQAMIKHRLYAINDPSLEIVSMDEESATVNIQLDIASKPTLGKYIGVSVIKDEVVIEDYEIEEALIRIQRKNTTYISKEEAASFGDQVILDFTGYKEGVEFEGGSAKDYPLVLGSNQFIPGFEDQIVGMNKNETKDICIPFPIDYPEEDLAGQDIIFKVTVSDIQEKRIPNMDDQLAQDEGYEDLEDLRNEINRKKYEERQSFVDQKFTNDVLEAIIKDSTFDIHDKMIEDDLDALMRELEENLKKQNFTLEMYCQITNSSIEDLQKGFREQAISRVKNRLVLEAIIDAEHIEASQQEIEDVYDQYSKQYEMSVDYIKQYISEDTVSYDICSNKAIQFVVNHAKY